MTATRKKPAAKKPAAKKPAATKPAATKPAATKKKSAQLVHVTDERAAQELAARKRARESLIDYCKYIPVPGKPVRGSRDDAPDWAFRPVEADTAAHHVVMLTIMEKVVTGEIPRAMFFLPPGSAKSTYGSAVSLRGRWGESPEPK